CRTAGMSPRCIACPTLCCRDFASARTDGEFWDMTTVDAMISAAMAPDLKCLLGFIRVDAALSCSPGRRRSPDATAITQCESAEGKWRPCLGLRRARSGLRLAAVATLPQNSNDFPHRLRTHQFQNGLVVELGQRMRLAVRDQGCGCEGVESEIIHI